MKDLKKVLKILVSSLTDKYILGTMLVSSLIGLVPLLLVGYWWVLGNLSILPFGRLIFLITLPICMSLSLLYIYTKMKDFKL